MAITSHAFGRVTLTDGDAKKFEQQVRYGRSNHAAKESVKRGQSMASALLANGVVRVKLTKPPKVKVG